MDSLLFLLIFSAFGIVSFAVGLFASRNVTSNTDYFLAGRELGLAAVTFTLIAIQLGGNMVLGAAEWAYTYGIYGILYALGMSLGFLLLASGFAAKLRGCNIATTAQLFEEKYASPALRKFASLISILSLTGILVSIVISSRSLIGGLGIHNESIFIIFWLFIIGYTMIGGLHAVVSTDIFQVLFIIICVGSLFFYCLWQMPSGFASLSQLVSEQSLFDSNALTTNRMIATFLMPALFALIEQDLAQPLFAARSQRIALMGALCAGIFIIVFGSIPVYFGMQARIIDLPLAPGSNPFIAVTEAITSPLLFVFVVCSVIAAITSTANSLLCAVSSNIVQDFFPIIGDDKAMLRVAKWVTCIVGIITVIASYAVHTTIIEVAIASYEISVSCLLIPLIGALYLRRPQKSAALVSAGCGLAGFIFFRLCPITWPKEIITLLLSLAGYVIMSGLNRTSPVYASHSSNK